ncbi:MAG: tetratricopeptide repeat protein, partial [Planctomycetes bacterium]|nr:tetratricopeptide repeat protein [Planctomycetota bacterium]
MASAMIMAITLTAGAANTVWQSRVVRTERDHAVEARKQSETLTAFFQKTLFSASPHRHGADTTVFELLEDAAGRVGAELAGDAGSQANVHYAIGETYAALGKHRLASQHLQAALASYRGLYGGDHERTANCLMQLGFLLAHQEDADSVGLLEEALAIRRRLYGEDHPLVADIRCRLAYALWHAAETPQLVRSEALMDEALRTYRLHLAEGHVRFAIWTHGMGGVRIGQNRTQDAVEFYQRARNMFLAAGVENHPNYIALLKHMAWPLQSLDRYAEARTVLSEYLDRRRVVLGAEWVTDDQWKLATFDTCFGDPADAFDVVAPSLPGFGFSGQPTERGMEVQQVAGMWNKLMTENLGYPRFAAQGGDIGAGVTSRLGHGYADSMIGIHLTSVTRPTPYLGPGSRELTEAEQTLIEQRERWQQDEGGYSHIQGTKPQTLAYGLNDSPVGLAA